MTPIFESANQVQRWALKNVIERGRESAPRHKPTRELLFASFSLANPRNRCVTIPERRWSLPLAIGEFCWHASGSDTVEFISYYTERWRDFSDDGMRIAGSCYGKKMFASKDGEKSPWSRMIDLLRGDPDTRRAIISFQDSTDTPLHAKDVACATSMQFLIRDKALHTVVNMRSNDCVWGLPYDLFVFSMFQELMATTLDLGLGQYHHAASSLHIYERHYELAGRVAEAPEQSSEPMPPMIDVSQLRQFLTEEEHVRLGDNHSASGNLNPYWSNLIEVLKAHRSRRGRT
jgi:thymidylate synthase